MKVPPTPKYLCSHLPWLHPPLLPGTTGNLELLKVREETRSELGTMLEGVGEAEGKLGQVLPKSIVRSLLNWWYIQLLMETGFLHFGTLLPIENFRTRSLGLWASLIKRVAVSKYISRIKVFLWVFLHPPFLSDVKTRRQTKWGPEIPGPSCLPTLLSQTTR